MTAVVVAAVLMAGLFQVYYLVTKRLQETGMPNLTVLHYQRLAVIPGALLMLVTFRKEHVTFLFEHPLVLGAIVFSSLVWIIHTYIRIYIVQAVSSMAFLNAFSAIISIPLLLGAGVVMNHDLPNMWMIIALCLLLLALLLRPSSHVENSRKMSFAIGILAAILLTAFGQSIDAVNMGAYRYFFQHIEFTFFGSGLFIFLSAFVINIFFLFVRHEGQPLHTHPYRWLPYSLPILFAVATFFEGFAVSSISIYALAAIGAFTFLLDTGSDLYHRRIRFSARTALFIALVIASSVLSAISTYAYPSSGAGL
jgi:drug/metabolite transporter (DMT)-like permease